MQGGRFGPGTPVVGKVRPTGLCICQQPRQVSDGRWSLARMPGAGASRRAMVVGTAWPISLATSNRGGCRGLPKLTTMTRSSWKSKTMRAVRSEEHTSELQSLMRISYAVFCLKKKTYKKKNKK